MSATAKSQLAHLWKVDGMGNIRNDLARIEGKSFRELTSARDKAMWIRVYDQAHNPQSYSAYSSKGKQLGLVTKKSGGLAEVGWARFDDIEKAVRAIEAKNTADIDRALGNGHKVRNFYNNIADPWNRGNFMTVDTHQVAAGIMQPVSGKSVEVQHAFGAGGIESSSKSGMSGTYGVHVGGGQKVARELGHRHANELQSIIWKATQEMFPASFKTKANQDIVRGILLEYAAGRISKAQAVQTILDLAATHRRSKGGRLK
jgi:hypothetical protein